ncbi:MAG: bls [Chlamydiales bacterium]|jgi:8-oxo-dGTP pyrophosphatase MutT (NUDIX family)/GNAT superfamily N-acetyltransferase|nr:bls [Chlamydiales bacterium]
MNHLTEYKLSIGRPEDIQASQKLTEGLSEEAFQAKGLSPMIPFSFFIEDKLQNVIGGITGFHYYNSTHIDSLWISKEFRNKGLGKKLLQEAEKLAVEQKCSFITVNTMDWEALPFYLHHAYQIEFVREGYAASSKLYMLKKWINPSIPEPKPSFKCPIAVIVMIRKENKVLLTLRKNTGAGDGFYALPGGRLDGNERLIDAICREAQEELGVVLNPTKIELRHILHCAPTPDIPRERLVFTFATDYWEGEITNCEPDKCAEVKWFDLDQLPDNLLSATKFGINTILSTSGLIFSDFMWSCEQD